MRPIDERSMTGIEGVHGNFRHGVVGRIMEGTVRGDGGRGDGMESFGRVCGQEGVVNMPAYFESLVSIRVSDW